jgi:RNA polymerase sigma-70 factor (ECF subfamily)
MTIPDDPAAGGLAPDADTLTAARNDPAALGQLLESFRDYLHGLAHGRRAECHWPLPFSISDLVQDTLVLAFEHFHAFRGSSRAELAGWLGAILRRLARRRSTAMSHVTGAGAAATSLAEPARREPPDPTTLPPDEEMIARERDEAVRRVVGTLPDDHRTALDLRYTEHLSYEEIGRRLGRTPDAARKLVARALAQVGNRLEPFR